MVLTSKGWYLNISARDNGGNSSTKQWKMRSADATEAAADASAILTAYNAITDLEISNYAVSNRYFENAFSFPAQGIEVQNQASLTVLIDGEGDKMANLKIPGPVIGLFMAPTGGGANIVDTLDTDLNTYLDLFKSGNECYISDGEDLGEIISGKRVHGKSLSG